MSTTNDFISQSTIAELADILEVLDGILSQYQIDFNTVLSQKEIKRKKSGGFDKGIYLKKTTSRTASGEGRIIVDKAPVDTKQGISKSTDWRRYPNANESLTRIKVPVTLDKWEVRPSVKSDNIDIVLRGERKQGVWQVEIPFLKRLISCRFLTSKFIFSNYLRIVIERSALTHESRPLSRVANGAFTQRLSPNRT